MTNFNASEKEIKQIRHEQKQTSIDDFLKDDFLTFYKFKYMFSYVK